MKNISRCCLVLFTGQVLPTTVPNSGIQLKRCGPFMKELGGASEVTKREADEVKRPGKMNLIGKALLAKSPFLLAIATEGKK